MKITLHFANELGLNQHLNEYVHHAVVSIDSQRVVELILARLEESSRCRIIYQFGDPILNELSFEIVDAIGQLATDYPDFDSIGKSNMKKPSVEI